MSQISFLNTENAIFLNEKYQQELLNEYCNYLTTFLFPDELKTFTFDHIEKKLYIATNRGKILEFRL